MEFIFQTTTELINLALGIWDVLLGIAGKVLELDIVLINGHGALLQVAELLTHAFNDTGWNVMRTVTSAKISPRDLTTTSGVFVLLPPVSNLIFELESGKLDIILRPHVTAFKVPFDICDPILSI